MKISLHYVIDFMHIYLFKFKMRFFSFEYNQYTSVLYCTVKIILKIYLYYQINNNNNNNLILREILLY